MNELSTLVISIFVGIIYSVFNLLTLSIICVDRKLRQRISNYPIASFLVGSAIQGVLPAPLYIYKTMKEQYTQAGSASITWLCDAYRFSFIFCVHITKISLLLISFERLFAVKFPYCYKLHVTKLRLLSVTAFIWILTVVVDIIPFIHGDEEFPIVVNSSFSHRTVNVSHVISEIGDDKNQTLKIMGIDKHCNYKMGHTWGIVVLVFYNLLPFVFIIVNYSMIWKIAHKFALRDRLRMDSLNSSYNNNNDNNQDQTNPSVTTSSIKSTTSQTRFSKLKFLFELKASKTSLTIFAAYFCCWFPMGVFYMMDHVCDNCLSNNNNYEAARRGVKILACTSSFFAPLIYCWWNKEFRKAARRLRKKRRKRRHFNEDTDIDKP